MAKQRSSGSGYLIVLEGIDGSGKTTVADALAEHLRHTGRPILATQEPTDSFVGTAVRGALSDPDHDPVSEALLFAADHAAHLSRIRAALDDGAIVVSDRYSTSWLVYQSITLQDAFQDADVGPREWLEAIVDPVEVTPDLVLLLDLPVETALERLDGRAEAPEKFEQAEFLKQVRGRYLELAQERGFQRVDASATLDETIEACREHAAALVDGGSA